jgi:hypothetical protein
MVGVRRGVSRLGCLVGLLLIVTVVYFGTNVGEVYFRYYRLHDAMAQQARFASTLDDNAIRTRLSALADSLGLPEEATRIRVQRSANRIVISTDYAERVELPLFVRTFRFAPTVEHRF